jgi:hypothetical protein
MNASIDCALPMNMDAGRFLSWWTTYMTRSANALGRVVIASLAPRSNQGGREMTQYYYFYYYYC